MDADTVDRQALLEHADVLGLLPHAHPIALVDRVLHVQPRQRIVTIKAVSGSEPCFASRPSDGGWAMAYPSVLLIESLVQSAALLWMSGRPPEKGERLLLAGLSDTTVGTPVLPGDVVRHDVVLTQHIGSNAMFSGTTEILSSGRQALTVGFLALARRC